MSDEPTTRTEPVCTELRNDGARVRKHGNNLRAGQEGLVFLPTVFCRKETMSFRSSQLWMRLVGLLVQSSSSRRWAHFWPISSLRRIRKK